MINFLVARKNDEIWKTYLETSIQKCGTSRVFQIMDQPGKQENIFLKYRAGIEALLKSECMDNDIVIFAHEDIQILDPFFVQKLETIFNEKKDIGLLGIAGARELNEQGGWWNNITVNLRGHLMQVKEGSTAGEAYHLVKGPCGYYDDLAVVDGCILVTTVKILREGLNFDAATFPVGNDMYDLDFSLQILEAGYKIAVADILILHKSQGLGALQESWKINHDKLIEKWKNKGYKFPIVSSDFIKKDFTVTNNIIEIEI